MPSALLWVVAGTSAMMAKSAMTPITVMNQNVERQPRCWPSRVPNGGPSTLAAVSLVNMMETAPAFLLGGTMSAATTDPILKNAPWHSAAMIRPVSITS